MNAKIGTLQMVAKIINMLADIDDSSYRKPLPVFSGSTLGQHFRHILDFYNCLINGVDNKLIDYCCRLRDPKVETSTSYASLAFQKLEDHLEELNGNSSLPVKADFSNPEEEIRPIVYSTIDRELMFAYDHAVHHLAMIKIGLKTHFPEMNIDENLGVAPSTLKHEVGRKASD